MYLNRIVCYYLCWIDVVGFYLLRFYTIYYLFYCLSLYRYQLLGSAFVYGAGKTHTFGWGDKIRKSKWYLLHDCYKWFTLTQVNSHVDRCFRMCEHDSVLVILSSIYYFNETILLTSGKKQMKPIRGVLARKKSKLRYECKDIDNVYWHYNGVIRRKTFD